MNADVKRSDPTWVIDEDLESPGVSLFAVMTVLIRHRWRVVRWAIIGGLVASLAVFWRAPMYRASATFIPQGVDASRSGLASLAGQFGVSLPGGSQGATQSPDFYSALLKSRVLLQPIVNDTFTVAEEGGKRMTFASLFRMKEADRRALQEDGVRRLGDAISTSVSKTTGVVGFSVVTRWPSVSLAITQRLIAGVNDFNLQVRQSQASAERAFIENRLEVARTDLRAAEDRFQMFLRENRQLGGSPELGFERDRLQRDLGLRQAIYTSLMQSYEDVRMREVRNTPVITPIEQPEVSTTPEPRGRLRMGLVGVALGAAFGAILALISELLVRGGTAASPDVQEFMRTLADAKARSLPQLRRRHDMARD